MAEADLPRLAAAPTHHQVAAAVLAAERLSLDGTHLDVARHSYRAVTGGLYRSRDLLAGEGVLVEAGLLVRTDEDILVFDERGRHLRGLSPADGRELVLAAWLESQKPAWLFGAIADGDVAWEYVPDEARETVERVVGGDRRLLDAFLECRVGKVDPERNAETGRLAEVAVAQAATAELAASGFDALAEEVRRVSEINDCAGYDVSAPRRDRTTRHMEVKGSRTESEIVQIHLSRNEARRGLADPDWSLVVCRVSPEDVVQICGWMPASSFEDELPHDQPGRARWGSAVIDVALTDLNFGLPPS